MCRTETSLAVIDVAGTDSSSTRRREVARQLDDVNRSLGFFQIVGHGISAQLVERMYDVTAHFFRLPPEQKALVLADRDAGVRGWEPVGEYALSRSLGDDAGGPDLREIFSCGRVPVEAESHDADAQQIRYFFGPTRWPAEPSGLESVWRQYYAEMEALAWRLFRLIEDALGLSPGWFTPFCDRHASVLLANYYPPVTSDEAKGQFRAGAHSDYGGVTILYQDDRGGLEVSDRRGGWLEVEPISGAFVVNIGDLLARWTNDRWVSTVHRVVCPSSGPDGAQWRLSLPFFQQPNPDALIQCIPGCEGPDGVKWAPITSGGHAFAKHAKTMSGGSETHTR